jgi:hypothetical protein
MREWARQISRERPVQGIGADLTETKLQRGTVDGNPTCRCGSKELELSLDQMNRRWIAGASSALVDDLPALREMQIAVDALIGHVESA